MYCCEMMVKKATFTVNEKGLRKKKMTRQKKSVDTFFLPVYIARLRRISEKIVSLI